MIKSDKVVSQVESLLLEKFNNRDRVAFGEVYNLFYTDACIYVEFLYKDMKVDSEDVVNDIFLYLWQKKETNFDDFLKVKGYIFIMIKNGFKNHIKHLKCEERFSQAFQNDSFKFDIIELEIYSIFEEAMNLLPEECRKVFQLYLEGVKPDEIAKALGKSKQTIYNKKQQAIAIIRSKLSKDLFMIFELFYLS